MRKENLKQGLILITYAIVLYLVLTNLPDLRDAVFLILRVLTPFIYGLIIAYLLNIPYTLYRKHLFALLDRRGGAPAGVAKYLALIMAYITVVLVAAVLIWIIIPQLVISITLLVRNIPYYITSIENLIKRIGGYFNQEDFYNGQLNTVWPNLISWSNSLLNDIISNFIEYFSTLTSRLYNFVISIAFSVYLLSGKETLIAHAKKVVCAYGPDRFNDRIIEVCARSNRIFTNFIGGNLLDAVLVGVICFVGMNVFKMPYPLLISVIIGVTNLIPIIGPFIGVVPGAMIILTVDPIKSLFFILFILVLQQLDGNIFKPKIFGNKVGLPSVWVLLSRVRETAVSEQNAYPAASVSLQPCESVFSKQHCPAVCRHQLFVRVRKTKCKDPC